MRRLSSWVSFLLCMGIAAPAWADASVVLLGIRSVEGDDAVATALTDALRAAATTVGGWRVEDRGPTMSQMSMAHGCDEVDARCLTDIAGGLEVDLIVYGSVRRTSTRSNFDYSLTLSLFDAPAGAIDRSITAKVRRADVDGGSLSTHASELIGQLTGQATEVELGALRVMLNITGPASIAIDGQPAGDASGGSFVLEGVAPGDHELSIEADGYEPFDSRFVVTAGEPTRVAANLTSVDGSEPPAPILTAGASYDELSNETGDGGGLPQWVPYTLLGVSGAALVGTVVSWVMIDSVNNDELFKEYSGAIYEENKGRGPGEAKITDVCAEAIDNANGWGLTNSEVTEVQDMCSSAATFEILQWVFLGTAVIAGGLGTYLLVAQPGASDSMGSAEQPRLSWRPSIGRDGGSVTATLQF